MYFFCWQCLIARLLPEANPRFFSGMIRCGLVWCFFICVWVVGSRELSTITILGVKLDVSIIVSESRHCLVISHLPKCRMMMPIIGFVLVAMLNLLFGKHNWDGVDDWVG